MWEGRGARIDEGEDALERLVCGFRVVPPELAVLVGFEECDGQAAAHIGLSGILQGVESLVGLDETANAGTKGIVADVVKKEAIRNEGVQDFLGDGARGDALVINEVGNHGDHRVVPGRRHIPIVASDSRVDLEEDRASIARVDLDVKVGEPPVVGRFEEPSSVVPQSLEGFGDHGHGVTDHRWGVVFKEHAG